MAETLLGSEIKGLPVRKILVTEKAEISKELYVGITVDGYSGTPVIVASTEGGVHIEETVRTAPEKIASIQVAPSFGFYPYQARTLLRKLGLDQRFLIAWADVICQLYNVFSQFEALIVEINPLVVLPNGGLLAVDAVLEVDNSALSRIKRPLPDWVERIENLLERRGREIGGTYVDLDGDIGLISSGAGLGMASMDIIGQKMKPANFLETGGGITTDAVIIVGEVGGEQEEKAARFIQEKMTKPVAAYIAGRYSPQGKQMGHAGAIVRGSAGTVAVKQEALRKAGAKVLESPMHVAQWAKKQSLR
jgi:succinyl-CoA synthetase beta subunit